MDNTVYTVDYFIKKYEGIDEMAFRVHGFAAMIGQIEARCALGWCKADSGLHVDSFCDSSKEADALADLFVGFHGGEYSEPDLRTAVATVNDGYNPDYQQPTPKQRILAALRDIKAKQQPEVKERIVYVTVDAPVRELQKVGLMEN